MPSSFQLIHRIPVVLPELGNHNVMQPLSKYMSDGNDSRFLNKDDDTYSMYNMRLHRHFHNLYIYLQTTEFNDVSKATWALYVLEMLTGINSIRGFGVLQGGLLGDEWGIDVQGNLF
jgi:hypothetical protein